MSEIWEAVEGMKSIRQKKRSPWRRRFYKWVIVSSPSRLLR